MAYRERRAGLLPAVLWSLDVRPGERDVLPDGSMDLIWDGERVLVTGPDRRPHAYHAAGHVRMSAIRFDPGVAPAVLGLRADELVDLRVDLAELWPAAETRRLCERLATSTTPAAELERTSAVRLRGDLRWATGVTAALRTGAAVDDVAAEFATSSRQLLRRSVAAFGYGPKLLQRILRVGAATDLLRAGRPLAEVAAETGFADYAHLYRDVLAITDRRPVTFQPSAA